MGPSLTVLQLFLLPPVFLCTNASRDSLVNSMCTLNLTPEQWTEWTSSYTCLFVDTGKCKVLVDTGAGSLGEKTGNLLRNLGPAGIAPGDINLVILTHAHPDHIGGNTDIDGKPVFVNAEWVISGMEWDFWTSPRARQTLSEHGKDVLINTAQKTFYH